MIRPGFKPAKFVLNHGHFDHQSSLHGINHTYRVMFHCLTLGSALRMEREMHLAFCAAFIHDMSRKHDGFCTKHGLWAAKYKLPVFNDFFLSQGINKYEIEEIKAAVQNHSEGFELKANHPFRKTTALLKDADALDRIRLGKNNLDPSFLRFKETIQYLPFAHTFYQVTDQLTGVSFNDMIKVASQHRSLLPEDSQNIMPAENL